MTRQRTAVIDHALRAVITTRTPLRYADGEHAPDDRPAHVRAASSLAWINGHIALIQDDANFVALVHPLDRSVRAVTLPAGHGGLRQFDEVRGNKAHKLDLEACVAIERDTGPLLLAFGSGSTAARRRILMVDQWQRDTPDIALVDAGSLYERLHATTDFAGSDMNIEGATLVGDNIRFFGRGNGAPRGELLPVNATCDVPLDTLLHYLAHPDIHPPPEPMRVVQYHLGHVDGVLLGFTDATTVGDSVRYSASAEHSSDSTTDGPVAGSVLGEIAGNGTVRYASITAPSGEPLRDKVEGVLMSRVSPQHAYLVVDRDDPAQPSELLEVELSGPWSV